MPNVTIHLSDDLRGKAEARAAKTGHGTVEQYVEALIRADAESDGPAAGGPGHLSFDSDDALEAMLLNRVDDAGGDVEATPEFWRDLKARALNRADGHTNP